MLELTETTLNRAAHGGELNVGETIALAREVQRLRGPHVPADWTDEHGELVAFAWMLDEVGAFPNAGSVIHYFNTPHDWSPEHARWVTLGRPGPENAKAWGVILDRITLSPEAQGIVDFFGDRSVPTGADPDGVKELASLGLLDLDDVELASNSRGTVYGWTAEGRVFLAARGAR